MNKVLSGLSETDRETEFVNIFQAIRKNIETPTVGTALATARPPAQRAVPEAAPGEEGEGEEMPIEVPPEFRISRQARRHLVEGLGFNPPEHRGERFWALFGEDEEVDLEAFTDTLLAVLGDVYGLPSDDFDISWEFVAV